VFDDDDDAPAAAMVIFHIQGKITMAGAAQGGASDDTRGRKSDDDTAQKFDVFDGSALSWNTSLALNDVMQTKMKINTDLVNFNALNDYLFKMVRVQTGPSVFLAPIKYKTKSGFNTAIAFGLSMPPLPKEGKVEPLAYLGDRRASEVPVILHVSEKEWITEFDLSEFPTEDNAFIAT
jgi:hypothetical protein